MRLIDMINTLRTYQFERIEVRDKDNIELFTCPTDSDVISSFKDCEVIEWFPHGSPDKDATFTVLIVR